MNVNMVKIGRTYSNIIVLYSASVTKMLISLFFYADGWGVLKYIETVAVLMVLVCKAL